MGIRRKRTELQPTEIGIMAQNRAEELRTILRSLQESTKQEPKGKLRVQKRGNSFQYYLRTDAEDTEGKYIRKRDRHIAKEIAQHEYEKEVIDELKNEMVALNQVIEYCDIDRIYDIFNSFHPGKKILLEQITLSEKSYVEKWTSLEYEKMGFAEDDLSEFFTSKDERVRSESEIVIADALARKGIPYRYEYPLELTGLGVVRPDFYCLNKRTRKEIVWEHLGMMSDYGYANKNVKKIEKYELNGYFPGDNLIVTMETDVCLLNTRLLDKIIDKYLI